MGGGTGNFIQCYLEEYLHLKSAGKPQDIPKIMMVDFVHEALLKARGKHRKIAQTDTLLTSSLGYIEANLELLNNSFTLPFKANSVSKILASLFISYLKNPHVTLKEFFRILKPGGMVVMSSLKPDTDMSKPIHSLIDKIRDADHLPYFQEKKKEELLMAVQSYINSAAYLTDLEEQKLFKFYSDQGLKELLEDSGFRNYQLYETFGNPAQGVIAIGYK
jgi:ubiquinone/menaquinone biosynthesis C-methylase UbiE